MNKLIILTSGWLLASFSTMSAESNLSVNRVLIGGDSLLVHSELVVMSGSETIAGMNLSFLDKRSTCKNEVNILQSKNKKNKFVTNENNGFYATMGSRSHENIWLIRHLDVLGEQCSNAGIFSIKAELKESRLPRTGRIHAPHEFDKPDSSQSVTIEKPYSIEETAQAPTNTRTVNQVYEDRSFVSITYFNDRFQSKTNPPDVDELATALCFEKNQIESSKSLKIPIEVGSSIQDNFFGHTVFPIVLIYDSQGKMNSNISYCNIHFGIKTKGFGEEVHDFSIRLDFEVR